MVNSLEMAVVHGGGSWFVMANDGESWLRSWFNRGDRWLMVNYGLMNGCGVVDSWFVDG